MKGLLSLIISKLVDDPDTYALTEIAGDQLVIFELRILKSEVGKIIGRNGRMAQSIRIILSAVARKLGTRVQFEIIEENAL